MATRQPFPGNKIPATSFDPAAKSLIDQFPQPNLPGDVGSSGVANNYLTNPSQKDDTDQFDVRVDHRFTDNDSLFVRFSLQDKDLLIPAPRSRLRWAAQTTPPVIRPPEREAWRSARRTYLLRAR